MCERAARSFHFPANACDKVGEVLVTLNVSMVSLKVVWFLSGLSLNMSIMHVRVCIRIDSRCQDFFLFRFQMASQHFSKNYYYHVIK